MGSNTLMILYPGCIVYEAEGHVDFAVEILAALELIDEETRERRRRFYKGEIMPALPQP